MSEIWPPMSWNWDCILQYVHIWKRMKQYAVCPLCCSVSHSASASNYCYSELVCFQAVWFSQGQIIHQPKQRGLTFYPSSSLPTLLSHCLSSVSQWNTCSASGGFSEVSLDSDHSREQLQVWITTVMHTLVSGVQQVILVINVETEPRSVKSAWGGLLK